MDINYHGTTMDISSIPAVLPQVSPAVTAVPIAVQGSKP